MADNLLTASTAAPTGVPDKFLDPQTGAVRVDALVKSYQELERRLAAGGAVPAPASPDGYAIACDHGLFEPCPEVNARLHAAGFAPAQAQLVYDLAAERLMPLIQELVAEFQADREVQRLVQHFGGDEKWRAVSRQLLAWAAKNLPAPAVEGLSTTYEGVMALYRMMTGSEPSALARGDAPAEGGETELHTLMRDPRYWRDRDPGVVARVTEGFQRLYPGGR
ncbi:capsid assembly protein [Azospirillum sp.]|uniref:capsid assembly protein n=1 Tax=Azospirillum sp. TaxID=34012 RepID=UPI003D762CC0